jgi:hypothetical protein
MISMNAVFVPLPSSRAKIEIFFVVSKPAVGPGAELGELLGLLPALLGLLLVLLGILLVLLGLLLPLHAVKTTAKAMNRETIMKSFFMIAHSPCDLFMPVRYLLTTS